MVLTLNLSPDESRRLAALAQREGRSVSDVAHDLLMGSVDEDAAEAAWASGAIADWESSDQEARPLSALRADLGL